MDTAPLIPYPEADALLRALTSGVRDVLGGSLVGLYLEGSLANDGFDADSDIDFVAVTEDEVTETQFAALQAMHGRLSAGEGYWAVNLEGSYLSRRAVRRHGPACVMHPNIERGRGERLKWARHGPDWDVHRWVLRERGITLAGPEPTALVDPVPPEALRRAARDFLDEWGTWLLRDPAPLAARGYQSYAVLSLCRVLYTRAHGAVAPKPVAAGWAREPLGEPWAALLERAWAGRHDPSGDASPEDVAATLQLLRSVAEMTDSRLSAAAAGRI